jgi:hypothetical protein
MEQGGRAAVKAKQRTKQAIPGSDPSRFSPPLIPHSPLLIWQLVPVGRGRGAISSPACCCYWQLVPSRGCSGGLRRPAAPCLTRTHFFLSSWSRRALVFF